MRGGLLLAVLAAAFSAHPTCAANPRLVAGDSGLVSAIEAEGLGLGGEWQKAIYRVLAMGNKNAAAARAAARTDGAASSGDAGSSEGASSAGSLSDLWSSKYEGDFRSETVDYMLVSEQIAANSASDGMISGQVAANSASGGTSSSTAPRTPEPFARALAEMVGAGQLMRTHGRYYLGKKYFQATSTAAAVIAKVRARNYGEHFHLRDTVAIDILAVADVLTGRLYGSKTISTAHTPVRRLKQVTAAKNIRITFDSPTSFVKVAVRILQGEHWSEASYTKALGALISAKLIRTSKTTSGNRHSVHWKLLQKRHMSRVRATKKMIKKMTKFGGTDYSSVLKGDLFRRASDNAGLSMFESNQIASDTATTISRVASAVTTQGPFSPIPLASVETLAAIDRVAEGLVKAAGLHLGTTARAQKHLADLASLAVAIKNGKDIAIVDTEFFHETKGAPRTYTDMCMITLDTAHMQIKGAVSQRKSRSQGGVPVTGVAAFQKAMKNAFAQDSIVIAYGSPEGILGKPVGCPVTDVFQGIKAALNCNGPTHATDPFSLSMNVRAQARVFANCFPFSRLIPSFPQLLYS
jgi:hypothetical protein